MVTLIYSAFWFPHASRLWIKVESFSVPRSSEGSSRCITVALILVTVVSSVVQAVFGTVCSMTMELKRNDTAAYEKINGFFAKYAVSKKM